MKRLFFDLETTGVRHWENAIHQLAGIIEIDGHIVEEFDFKIKPHAGAVIEQKALEVGGVTLETINSYPESRFVYFEFLNILNKYVSRYDKKDKFHLIGYNNAPFDNQFLRAWFDVNQDKYFGSWFWSDTIDVLCLASKFLEPRRREMENFKLMTVARFLGFEVEDDKLHDGLYDIQLTRKIFNHVS